MADLAVAARGIGDAALAAGERGADGHEGLHHVGPPGVELDAPGPEDILPLDHQRGLAGDRIFDLAREREPLGDQLPHRQPMPGRVDRDVGDVIAAGDLTDRLGLPGKVAPVEPQLFQHAELAASLLGRGDHGQRGIVAALLVRVIAQPHRLVGKRAARRDLDQGGLEIAPAVEAVDARRGDPREGEAALAVVDELAVVEVAEFLVARFLPQFLAVDQPARAPGDGIVERDDLLPAPVGHHGPGAQVRFAVSKGCCCSRRRPLFHSSPDQNA
jgi:hypothetical protein